MQWTPEREALRAQYEAFGREHIARRAPVLYENHKFDFESWQQLADLGFWKIAMPREYGGMGLSWWDFAAGLEAFSRTGRDLGFSLSIIAHAGFMRSLMLFGTEHQKRTFLPRLMGGAIGATAMTEKTGGSDVSRIKTHAVQNGDGYVLNGEKWHITNAPVADLMMVLARVPALGMKQDITIFMIDRSMSGVSTGEPERMLGNHTSPTGNLYLQDVHVSSEHMVGGLGQGLSTIYNTISLDRLMYGLLAASYLEPILDDVMAYAHERQAFGQQIADFQYVQARITNIKIAIETTRSVSYSALSQLIDGDPQAVTTCSIAKMVGSESLAACTQDAMRLYGHLGYMEGPISNCVRDALGTLIAGGTSEMQRKNIFNQMSKQWRTAQTVTAEREDQWTAV